jgi:hypothetical protein
VKKDNEKDERDEALAAANTPTSTDTAAKIQYYFLFLVLTTSFSRTSDRHAPTLRQAQGTVYIIFSLSLSKAYILGKLRRQPYNTVSPTNL